MRGAVVKDSSTKEEGWERVDAVWGLGPLSLSSLTEWASFPSPACRLQHLTCNTSLHTTNFIPPE